MVALRQTELGWCPLTLPPTRPRGGRGVAVGSEQQPMGNCSSRPKQSRAEPTIVGALGIPERRAVCGCRDVTTSFTLWGSFVVVAIAVASFIAVVIDVAVAGKTEALRRLRCPLEVFCCPPPPPTRPRGAMGWFSAAPRSPHVCNGREQQPMRLALGRTDANESVLRLHDG